MTEPPTSVPGRRAMPLAGPVIALLTGGGWAGIMAARLFVGGAVGMADNGDSRRLMCQLGVRALRPFNADATKFIYPVWVAHHWYGEACGADGSGEPYRSSELWLLSMAKHLTPLLGFSGTLDLRVVGVMACVLVGVAVALLVLVLPGPWWARVLLASGFALAIGDSAVADYFVSPYSEPAALLGGLLLIVILLWIWSRGYTTWTGLILIALVGAFTMAAKTQSVALLPALALGILWLPHGNPTRRPKAANADASTRRPLVQVFCLRLPALFTSVALLVAAVVILEAAPKRFNQIDSYDEVFNEILVHSPNPAADLKALGVDPSLAYARGSNVLSSNSAATSPSYLQFRSHVTEGLILEFYAAHPTRLLPVFGDGLHAMSVWRENYLGSYQDGSGHPPGALEHRLSVFSWVFHGAPSIVFALVWITMLVLGLLTAWDRTIGKRERALGRLAVVLAVASAFEFWSVMLGEGRSDLYKHIVLTNELFAFGVVATAACAVSRTRSLARSTGWGSLGPEGSAASTP